MYALPHPPTHAQGNGFISPPLILPDITSASKRPMQPKSMRGVISKAGPRTYFPAGNIHKVKTPSPYLNKGLYIHPYSKEYTHATTPKENKKSIRRSQGGNDKMPNALLDRGLPKAGSTEEETNPRIKAAQRLKELGDDVDWHQYSLLELLDRERRIETAQRLAALGVTVDWHSHSFEELLKLEQNARSAVATDVRWKGLQSKLYLDGVMPDPSAPNEARISEVTPASRLEPGGVITGVAKKAGEGFVEIKSWTDLVSTLSQWGISPVRVRWRTASGTIRVTEIELRKVER